VNAFTKGAIMPKIIKNRESKMIAEAQMQILALG
jgi:hypothetical protein